MSIFTAWLLQKRYKCSFLCICYYDNVSCGKMLLRMLPTWGGLNLVVFTMGKSPLPGMKNFNNPGHKQGCICPRVKVSAPG